MLDSKEISAVELTEQYLDRIENSDKEINSYITVCKENALADAKKAQEVIDSGNSGAFTGLFRLKITYVHSVSRQPVHHICLMTSFLRITQR